MAFVGELEHLPIVDVIQLLNSTRKSGTLCIKSKKGESQLVFIDGFIVSANHVNTSVRIGQILKEMKAITREDLESVLAEQFNAGTHKQPLIATLIEKGTIEKDVAYRGLETLIEMTIVEVLTWETGTFELDVDKITISDEYRYFPEKLKQDIMLNPQSILMDALRIYDEKMRDGTLTDQNFSADDAVDAGFDMDWESSDAPPPLQENIAAANDAITADLLGLDELDDLEKKIPDVFNGVREVVDPSELKRKSLKKAMGALPEDQKDRLLNFLDDQEAGKRGAPAPGTPYLSLILYSCDELISTLITTLFGNDGHIVFTTDDSATLDHMIDKANARELAPVLLIDAPGKEAGPFSVTSTLSLVKEKHLKYAQIPIIQLAGENEAGFSLLAVQGGARLVLPWPGRTGRQDKIAEEIIVFLNALQQYLTTPFAAPEPMDLRILRDCIFELDTLSDAPEVTFVILRFASTIFERALTFVVGKSDLIAEKSIGIQGDKSEGTSAPLMFRIPLAADSILSRSVASGQMYVGNPTNETLTKALYQEVPAPGNPTVGLIPIKCMGRVIAVIYGDFGQKAGTEVPIDQLEILAHHAGLVLENTFYRKKFTPSG